MNRGEVEAVAECLAEAHDEIDRIDRMRAAGFPRHRAYERACAETDVSEGRRALGRVLAAEILATRAGGAV